MSVKVCNSNNFELLKLCIYSAATPSWLQNVVSDLSHRYKLVSVCDTVIQLLVQYAH